MLIVQRNCGKEYECTISTLEAGLCLDAAVLCIQEPYLGDRNISHLDLIYTGLQTRTTEKDLKVLTVVRKHILNHVVINNQTDLVSHPYCLVLDIKNFILGLERS